MIWFVAILIGLIPAVIAQGKGKSFIVWWFYGAALFIVALPHALIMKPDESLKRAYADASGSKKCLFCAELIKEEARVCRYCGRDVAQ